MVHFYFSVYGKMALVIAIVLPPFVFLTALLAEYGYTETFSRVVVRLKNIMKKSLPWVCGWYALLALVYYLIVIASSLNFWIILALFLFFCLSIEFLIALYETYKKYS